MSLAARKADHLRIAAGPGVEHTGSTGLERVRLRHRALPERDLGEVTLATELCGRRLAAPLLVSAMTGGTPEAAEVNRALTAGAVQHGIGLVLGSGRKLLDEPALLDTYRPARADRPPLLLANLGAPQVRGRTGTRDAVELVERLDADGLTIHLNPLQEAVQPEGEPDFAGVLEGIGEAVRALAPRPVVVKEVGFGLDPADVSALRCVGVAAVDVAGSGGTNWALIEGRRDDRAGGVAAAFADWGRPTAEAIVAARGGTVIASGGVRDGVEAVKCLALGATAVGLARPFLLAARAGEVGAAIAEVVEQVRIATWLAGAGASAELGEEHLA